MTQRIVLLAKAPIPGQVKTRLQPHYSAQASATIHTSLVHHAVEQACAAECGSVELHSNGPHPLFAALEKKFPITLASQSNGDLGERIAAAMTKGDSPCLLLGCDCPCITFTVIRECARLLVDASTVFLPAEDGGFGLIGVRNPQSFHFEEVFSAVEWGGDTVMARIRSNMRQIGQDWLEGDYIWDVDLPADIERLEQSSFSHILT